MVVGGPVPGREQSRACRGVASTREPPSASVRNPVASRAEVIEGVAEKYPALAKLEVKSHADDGVARVTHGPASHALEIAALEKPYTPLDREEWTPVSVKHDPRNFNGLGQ